MATFLIDHPNRELPSVSLIDEEKNRDFEIFVDYQDNYFGTEPTNTDFWRRLRRDKDFILTPSYNVKRTPLLALRSKLARIPLVVYHSEQFYKDYLAKEKLNLDFIEQYNRDVAYHLVWGEYYKEKLLKAGVPLSKIFVVGNWKTMFPSTTRYGVLLPATKKHDFLFLSNFVLADYSGAKMEQFKADFSLPAWYDPQSYVSSCRIGMLNFVTQLAARRPDASILVRRHPGEDSKAYEMVSKLSNVTLSNDGPLKDDLGSASLVLTQDSTSIFECQTLGVPHISVAFAKPDERYRAEPAEFFDLHDSDLVLKALSSKSSMEQLGEYLAKELRAEHYIDSSKTIDDLVKVLNNIANEEKRKVNFDFRFVLVLLTFISKWILWRLALRLNKVPVFSTLYERIRKSERAWLRQDHFFARRLD